ncbi:MAG: ABC transporter ATP-binding protein [Methylotetracoccus sp.]
MSDPAVLVDRASKKFRRSLRAALRAQVEDWTRRLLRRPPSDTLRADEFWALDGVSTAVARGECLGVVGPNGAGKSTLLRLIAGEHRPDRGRVIVRGGLRRLMRLEGLKPLLTGRENVYVGCSELGLQKRDIDRRFDDIVGFAGIGAQIDLPVRHYSDGMYARLALALATSVPVDVLLIDEVLAVGDLAFQLRCLDRLNHLKRDGTAIVFVSHSEMNVRHIADRCLLLFDGRPLVQGPPDAVFYKYHEAAGYLNRLLEPLGLMPSMPGDFAVDAAILRLRQLGSAGPTRPGGTYEWSLDYRIGDAATPVHLLLQFWNSAGLLTASIDTRMSGYGPLPTLSGEGSLSVRIPFVALAAGRYRVAGGFVRGERLLCYHNRLADLDVADHAFSCYGGGTVVPAEFSIASRASPASTPTPESRP